MRVENLPKNLDFVVGTDKINQVVSYENVRGFIEQRLDCVEDSMLVTGLKMGSANQTQTVLNPNPKQMGRAVPLQNNSTLEKVGSRGNLAAGPIFHQQQTTQQSFQNSNYDAGSEMKDSNATPILPGLGR